MTNNRYTRLPTKDEPDINLDRYPFKYRITLAQLLDLNLKNSINLGIAACAKKEFFEEGQGAQAEDCFLNEASRHWYFKGVDLQKKDDGELFSQAKLGSAPHRAKIKRRFSTHMNSEYHAESIIQSMSQGIGRFITDGVQCGLKNGIDIFALDTKSYISNIASESDPACAFFIVKKFRVNSPKSVKSDDVGFIPGPIRVRYKQLLKNGVPGYQLESIETDNLDLLRMLTGESLDEEEIQKKYCNTEHNQAIEALEATINNESYPLELRRIGANILAEVNHVVSTSAPFDEPTKTPLAEYTKVLRIANNVITAPEENISECLKQTRNCREKVIGGLLLGLAGVAIIVSSLAIAGLSCGLLSPVTIAGHAVGLSLISAAIGSIGGAIAMTSGLFGSATLFKAARKPLLREEMAVFRKDMEELVAAAKPKASNHSRLKLE